MSEGIAKLVSMATDKGMAGELIHWSKADVWTFEGIMPDDILRTGSAIEALDYFEQAANGPHRADTGFIDGAAKIAISFDKQKDDNAQD